MATLEVNRQIVATGRMVSEKGSLRGLSCGRISLLLGRYSFQEQAEF